MPDSQLYVYPEVNVDFIASDQRSTDHAPMDRKAIFKRRLDEAAREAGFESRVAFAIAIGAGDNAKQVAQQWVDRQKVPDKYRVPMEGAGVSIDYVNGDSQDVKPRHPRASQSTGLDADKLALVLGVVEGAIADSRKRVPTEFKARMIKRVYESQPTLNADSASAVQAALAGILETVGSE